MPVRMSVRALMILVLIVGGGLGWVAHRSHLQRRAVAAVRGAKGSVSYDWQIKGNKFQKGKGPRGPAWLRRLVGDEPFQYITRVDLTNGRSDDTVMAAIASQGRLESLSMDQPRLTDAGFASLGALTGLRELRLGGKAVGDAGMVHVGKLIGLDTLSLEGTSVGDAGLVHLAGLKQLEILRLDSTPVTDAGMVHLSGLRSLKMLALNYTKVGDPGLVPLRGLPLAEIMLYECPTTREGVAALAATLPKSAEVWGP